MVERKLLWGFKSPTTESPDRAEKSKENETMEKTLFWTEEAHKNGDTFLTGYTFDEDEATKNTILTWDVLTKSEKEKVDVSLSFCEYSGDKEGEDAYEELADAPHFGYDSIPVVAILPLSDRYDELYDAVYSAVTSAAHNPHFEYRVTKNTQTGELFVDEYPMGSNSTSERVWKGLDQVLYTAEMPCFDIVWDWYWADTTNDGKNRSIRLVIGANNKRGAKRYTELSADFDKAKEEYGYADDELWLYVCENKPDIMSEVEEDAYYCYDTDVIAEEAQNVVDYIIAEEKKGV